eukprot:6971904-Pyramimonas_sp.AAC.1
MHKHERMLAYNCQFTLKIKSARRDANLLFNKRCPSMRSVSTYKENGSGACVRAIDAHRLCIPAKRYWRSCAKPWPRNGPE